MMLNKKLALHWTLIPEEMCLDKDFPLGSM